MVGQIYSSKKDSQVSAKVISFDDKFNTVLIEYLTGDKIGKTANITTSTLKRWWKIEDQDRNLDILNGPDGFTPEQKEVEVQTIKEKELVTMPGIEKLSDLKKEYDKESELTDKNYAKIGLEICKQAEQKSENIKSNINNNDIVETLKSKYDLIWCEYANLYKVKVKGKTVIEVSFKNKKVVVYSKKVNSELGSKDGYHYHLPVKTGLNYDNNLLDNIVSLI